MARRTSWALCCALALTLGCQSKPADAPEKPAPDAAAAAKAGPVAEADATPAPAPVEKPVNAGAQNNSGAPTPTNTPKDALMAGIEAPKARVSSTLTPAHTQHMLGLTPTELRIPSAEGTLTRVPITEGAFDAASLAAVQGTQPEAHTIAPLTDALGAAKPQRVVVVADRRVPFGLAYDALVSIRLSGVALPALAVMGETADKPVMGVVAFTELALPEAAVEAADAAVAPPPEPSPASAAGDGIGEGEGGAPEEVPEVKTTTEDDKAAAQAAAQAEAAAAARAKEEEIKAKEAKLKEAAEKEKAKAGGEPAPSPAAPSGEKDPKLEELKKRLAEEQAKTSGAKGEGKKPLAADTKGAKVEPDGMASLLGTTDMAGFDAIDAWGDFEPGNSPAGNYGLAGGGAAVGGGGYGMASRSTLRVRVSAEGIALNSGDEDARWMREPIERCATQENALTLCLKDPQATEPLARYDWVELYNDIASVYVSQKLGEMRIEVHPDVPLEVALMAWDIANLARTAGKPFQPVASLDGLQAPTSAGPDRVLGLWDGERGEAKEPNWNLSRTHVRARLKPTNPDVVGSLDRRIIRKVVNRHKIEVKRCFERELIKSPTLAGKIIIHFTIESTGSVGAVQVNANAMGNDTVADCLTTQIQTWKFPAPKGGGDVKVTYPFLFSNGR